MKVAMIALMLGLTAFAFPGEDNLPLNKVQSIGSHNSYKIAIDPKVMEVIRQHAGEGAKGLEYTHISLEQQLDLGLRGLELDVYADSAGGKYLHPFVLEQLGLKPVYNTDVMKEPGFKVFHMQDVDVNSNCPTFKIALEQLKNWSNAHPDHSPVFITMNAKDEISKRPEFTKPEPFTPAVYERLDKEIIDYLGKDKLITPDDIRGKDKTLEAAVLKGHWPTVGQAKGKFIFILDEKDPKMSDYMQGHPSLKGRVLFVNAPAGKPEAAIMIINDAIKDQELIKQMVAKGYIVRTRADADTKEARTNDYTRYKAACESGAQIITTDYYQKSTLFPSDYIVNFGNNEYSRKDIR
ncbi:phosphatidylinositol-specific phospholipase C1-like protein [Chitinophaga sp. LS1]|uniref:phosphatidylinositol-specific phospholipase C1-like protein n=1 Tax=Chitinophaga sp. LS1 TaxID=3051176 RepID=UPI002AABA199|nr:phosphatidylinositol-specific phospholipase C1-like protein [Chitinophaga sp. LS1]WPV64890.1 phosphatidylinositol-specific phospholipase C1-like protein [Chitinophaga sp. LS1]